MEIDFLKDPFRHGFIEQRFNETIRNWNDG